MFVEKVRQSLRDVLYLFKYELNKINTKHIDIGSKNVVTLKYLYDQKYKYISDLPVSRCRDLLWFKLDKYHPFCNALSEYKKSDKPNIIKEELFHYYKKYQPKTALEYLELNKNEAPGLKDCDPLRAFSLPWSPVSKTSIDIYEMREARKNCFKKTVGSKYIGPVNENKLDYEYYRLLNIITLINEKGYNRSSKKDGDITGKFLIDEMDNWVFLITKGHHRASALAALGYKSIPVRIEGSINNFIFKNEVNRWPQVVDGNYTKEGALKVFARIFTGEQKGQTVKEWKKYIDKKKYHILENA